MNWIQIIVTILSNNLGRYYQSSTKIYIGRRTNMARCADCSYFFSIPAGDYDYEKGKGDCVHEEQDQKGKFWLSRPVLEESDACAKMKARK
jgi:benzylsuccinate synthase